MARSGRSVIRRLARSWVGRVAVSGHSMEPLLREGDWLLVDTEAPAAGSVLPGDLVVARAGAGLVIKRVAAVLPGRDLLLAGVASAPPGHRHEVTIASAAVVGRPWFRYWPPRRLGPIPRALR